MHHGRFIRDDFATVSPSGTMVTMLTFDEVEIHARRDQGSGSLDDEALAEFTQIGRASCRERV